MLFQNYTKVTTVGKYVDEPNVLGLILCSFIFGLILKIMGEGGKILADIADIINEFMKYVVNLVML